MRDNVVSVRLQIPELERLEAAVEELKRLTPYGLGAADEVANLRRVVKAYRKRNAALVLMLHRQIG